MCDNRSPTARKLLILNGEMSEWLKEHAWKSIPGTLSKDTPRRIIVMRLNDLHCKNVFPCSSVIDNVSRGFEGHLRQSDTTQILLSDVLLEGFSWPLKSVEHCLLCGERNMRVVLQQPPRKVRFVDVVGLGHCLCADTRRDGSLHPDDFAPQSKPSRARDVPDTQPLESFRARLSKSLYYNDPNGEKVLVSANNRRAYKLLPLRRDGLARRRQ